MRKTTKAKSTSRSAMPKMSKAMSGPTGSDGAAAIIMPCSIG